jgi:signal transduction histidine kinase
MHFVRFPVRSPIVILQDKLANARAVSKLRLALGIIALLIGLAVFLIAMRLVDLRQSQLHLIGNTFPALVQSERLGSLLAQDLVLTSDLRRHVDPSRLNSTEVDLRHNIEQLRNSSSKLAQLMQTDEGASPDFDLSLTRLELSNKRMLAVRRSVVRWRAQLAAVRAKLDGYRDEVKATAEPLISRSVNDSESTREASQVNLRLLNAIDLVDQLAVGTSNETVDKSVELTEGYLDIAARSLSEIAEHQVGRKLATLTQEFRAFVFNPDGVVASVRKLNQFEDQFVNEQLLHASITSVLLARVAELVRQVNGELSNHTTNFEARIFRTGITLALTTLALFLILGALYFVLERRLKRRLGELTKAILDIAGGDHNREVKVSGSDELGLMAQSLEVFKSNARELQRSNKELETFASAASHDMRAPLRAIENLATWTLEDNPDDLPKACVDNLNTIIGRAKRLSVLQTDLLAYAKAGQEGSDIESIELQSFVDELAEISLADTQFSIELSTGLGTISTHLTVLRQIMMNLISNSVKHHDRLVGKIAIDVKTQSGRLWIDYSDDGPGIDPDYHERIFELFQTLQSRDEVSGSGLGLSLVRKLVAFHGGTLTVASDPSKGRGTTFSFDFPEYPA